MKTDDLRAFDVVVRSGSISRAAVALQLTQSAITRRIQNLEEALGAQLLDRSTKPPKPTALGLRVHEQTRSVLKEIDMLRTLVAHDGAPSGNFRAGITHSMSTVGMIGLASDLKAAFPGVGLQFSSDWSRRLIEKVEGGHLDAAAVFMPPTTVFADGLRGTRLHSTLAVVIGQRGARARPARRLRDVSAEGWVLNPEGCGFRESLLRALASQGLPFTLNLETFGTDLQIGLVGAGHGLGLVSLPALAASPDAGTVDVLALKDFKLPVDVWLVSPTVQGNLRAAADRFGRGIAASFSTPEPLAPPSRRKQASAPPKQATTASRIAARRRTT